MPVPKTQFTTALLLGLAKLVRELQFELEGALGSSFEAVDSPHGLRLTACVRALESGLLRELLVQAQMRPKLGESDDRGAWALYERHVAETAYIYGADSAPLPIRFGGHAPKPFEFPDIREPGLQVTATTLIEVARANLRLATSREAALAFLQWLSYELRVSGKADIEEYTALHAVLASRRAEFKARWTEFVMLAGSAEQRAEALEYRKQTLSGRYSVVQYLCKDYTLPGAYPGKLEDDIRSALRVGPDEGLPPQG